MNTNFQTGPYTQQEKINFRAALETYPINEYRSSQRRFRAMSAFMGTREEESIRSHYNLHIKSKGIREDQYQP